MQPGLTVLPPLPESTKHEDCVCTAVYRVDKSYHLVLTYTPVLPRQFQIPHWEGDAVRHRDESEAGCTDELMAVVRSRMILGICDTFRMISEDVGILIGASFPPEHCFRPIFDRVNTSTCQPNSMEFASPTRGNISIVPDYTYTDCSDELHLHTAVTPNVINHPARYSHPICPIGCTA
ncbi:hypothetical protein OPQ81_000598 [Rhizoctonia solani]|nr:hypothetical protein OPQ81_000598 [Rhizoctonia solani]